MHRRIVAALACLALASGWLPAAGAAPATLAAPAATADATVQYDPRRIVLELAPETPRPRRGLARSLAGAPALTGIASIDAVNAALGVTAWEPGFPEAYWRADSPEDLSRFLVVTLPDGASLASALAAYAGVAGIAAAEPVAQCPVAIVPNDSLFASQYALQDPEDNDIDAPEAWDVFRGDSTMVVTAPSQPMSPSPANVSRQPSIQPTPTMGERGQ